MRSTDTPPGPVAEDLLNAIALAVVATDLDGLVQYWNHGAEALYGWSRDEVLGRNILEVVPALASHDEASESTGTLRSDCSWTGEASVHCRDGSERAVAVTASPLTDAEGNRTGGVSVSTLIAARATTSSQTTPYDQQTLEILETITDGFMALDDGLTFVYFNQAAERLLALRRENVVGRSVRGVFPDALGRAFEENAQKALRSGKPVSFTDLSNGHSHDGWYAVDLYPKDRGLTAYFRVITLEQNLRQRAEELIAEPPDVARAESLESIVHELEVHQLELEMQNEALRYSQRQLQRARDRFAELYDQAPVGYATLDEAGVILQANLTMAKMLGRARESLVGEPLIHFVMMDDRDTFYLHRRQLSRTGTPQIDEVRMLGPDGAQIWVSLDSALITDQGGLSVTLMALTDITDERRLRQELWHQERLAAVGQMAGGVAHDFNNLLASITLYSQLILGREAHLVPSSRRALTTILAEAKHGANLVQQILDYSRRSMLQTTSLDLVHFLPQVLEILRPMVPESIDLLADFRCPRCLVTVDPTRLQQALINLAMNARDAMPQGGRLDIRVDQLALLPEARPPVPGMAPGLWARINVSDTGEGMAEEVLAHIYEPFFTTKPPGKGTGLGLSQVYGIVIQHDGHIDVRSEVGVGTTFSIYLPVSEHAREAGEGTTAETDSESGAGQRVLLVEDREALRTAIAGILTSGGYTVIAAGNGLEALELARREAPDIIVTDVVLPGLGGIELLAQLRQARPGLPAIAVTGYTLELRPEHLEAAGFDVLLQKPFDIQELMSAVAALLGDGRERFPGP